MNRFSEDLDFILLNEEKNFSWNFFLKKLELEFQSYNLTLETIDRSKADSNVKKAFLKDYSFGKIL